MAVEDKNNPGRWRPWDCTMAELDPSDNDFGMGHLEDVWLL